LKTLLRIEEAFLFLLSIFLFSRIGYAWWWFPLLLFAPDIGMLGYLLNPQAGASFYNFIHHRGVAVVLYVLGVLLSINVRDHSFRPLQPRSGVPFRVKIPGPLRAHPSGRIGGRA